MNITLLKLLYRPVTSRAARASLIGRNRDRNNPDKGRFTRAEVDNILKRVWLTYDQLAPLVPQETTLGNRMVVLLSCVTLACFRVLMAAGIERHYAVELIGDVAWKVLEKFGRLTMFVAGLLSRDPRERLRMSVNSFSQFPFTPPGYVEKRLPSSDGVSMDMLRCTAAEYFRKQDASDLCIGTWCNLDYALAEMWGGWLERTETLAAGYTRCDFRFKTNAGE
jgi:ubiquinone biosynthesis protein